MSVKISLLGDFCPVGQLSRSIKGGNTDWLSDLGSLFQEADYNIVNLECPLTNAKGKIVKSGPHLKADPESIELLKRASISVVNIANNHIMDYGLEGVSETVRLLDQYKIDWVGVRGFDRESHLVLEKDNTRVALVSFTENESSTILNECVSAEPMDFYRQLSIIKTMKEAADIVIVQYHGGVEMFDYPTPRQKEYAHYLVDIGADLVICHHSHCISGYEMYKDKLIYYGLGNFFFPEEGNDEKWFHGIAVRVDCACVNKVDFVPFRYDMLCNKLRSDSLVNEYVLSTIEKLNTVINDHDRLDKVWEAHFQARGHEYLKMLLRPGMMKRGIMKLGLFKDLLTRNVSPSLLNIIRCESHRDILIGIIEDVLRGNKC